MHRGYNIKINTGTPMEFNLNYIFTEYIVFSTEGTCHSSTSDLAKVHFILQNMVSNDGIILPLQIYSVRYY